MWIYWLMFLVPAVLAISNQQYSTKLTFFSASSYAVLLILIIGLRFEVGTDWDLYASSLDVWSNLMWSEVLFAGGDPAYVALNKLASELHFGVWLPNLVCAIAFVSGFIAFARTMPNVCLALALGIPYMTIVLSMNYTRQGAALGFVLWGLTYLMRGRVRAYLLFIAVGTLFHRTAVVMVLLAGLFDSQRKIKSIFIGCLALIVLDVLFFYEYQQAVIDNYFGSEMASEGASIRVFMNVIASILYLFYKQHLDITNLQRQFWTRVAFICLLFMPIVFLSPSSTAVDRLALYFMPIQMFCFSHVVSSPEIIRFKNFVTLSILALYSMVLFIWFNYSSYASYWLPYKFYPFQ